MIFFEFPSSWSSRTIIFRIKVNHKPEFLVVSMQDLVGYFQNNKHFITNLIKELFVWQLAHHSAYPCCMPHIPIAHCLSCSRRSCRDLSHHPKGCFVFSLMFTKRKSLPRPRPHTKLKLATKVSQFVVKSQRIAVNRKINARIFPNEFLFFLPSTLRCLVSSCASSRLKSFVVLLLLLLLWRLPHDWLASWRSEEDAWNCLPACPNQWQWQPQFRSLRRRCSAAVCWLRCLLHD